MPLIMVRPQDPRKAVILRLRNIIRANDGTPYQHEPGVACRIPQEGGEDGGHHGQVDREKLTLEDSISIPEEKDRGRHAEHGPNREN